MAENTKIEWCDHTFNPWRGCTKVSPGCAHCYAETLSKRNPAVLGEWGPGRPRVRAAAAQWKLPLKWDRQAADAAYEHASEAPLRDEEDFPSPPRPRVFCASLADWLDDEVPIEWLADLLALILRTPNLDWLLLTKRPQLWRRRISAAMVELDDRGENIDSCALTEWIAGDPPANVWIGTSVEDQQRADERVPALLQIPAKVRFLSCEPLLGAVDLRPDMGGERAPVSWLENGCTDERIHWVIAGGESGKAARPMHPDWARSLRDQCAAAGVPFFFKQWGEWAPATKISDRAHLLTLKGKWTPYSGCLHLPHQIEEMAADMIAHLERHGKKKAGRTLDGREWNEFPILPACGL